MNSKPNKKMRVSKKWIVGLMSIIGIFLIGVAGYAFYLYHSVEDTVESMHDPIKREKSEKRNDVVEFKEQVPISVLLIGVDENEGDRGRSDTLIALTVNPNKKSTQMVSIPRDTRTEIIGKGFNDKINHSYAFGGPEMTINTVENFLDIPIDYFIQVNMESFKDIVNTIGGVTVNNSFAFSYEGHTFNEGLITLNGDEALAYSRMRKEDPKGDFGRQERQRQIIQAIIKQGASLTSIPKANDLLNILGENIKTNLTFKQMVDIQKNYKAASGKLEQLQIVGRGASIDGVYYYIVSDENRTDISSKLKLHLELNDSTKKQ